MCEKYEVIVNKYIALSCLAGLKNYLLEFHHITLDVINKIVYLNNMSYLHLNKASIKWLKLIP